MTKAQLNEKRGKEICQQIEIILNICSQAYTDVIKSVQPIMTKIPVMDDDDDINDEDDIDMIKNTLNQIFKNYVQVYKKERLEEMTSKTHDISNEEGNTSDGDDDAIEDKEKLDQEI